MRNLLFTYVGLLALFADAALAKPLYRADGRSLKTMQTADKFTAYGHGRTAIPTDLEARSNLIVMHSTKQWKSPYNSANDPLISTSTDLAFTRTYAQKFKYRYIYIFDDEKIPAEKYSVQDAFDVVKQPYTHPEEKEIAVASEIPWAAVTQVQWYNKENKWVKIWPPAAKPVAESSGTQGGATGGAAGGSSKDASKDDTSKETGKDTSKDTGKDTTTQNPPQGSTGGTTTTTTKQGSSSTDTKTGSSATDPKKGTTSGTKKGSSSTTTTTKQGSGSGAKKGSSSTTTTTKQGSSSGAKKGSSSGAKKGSTSGTTKSSTKSTSSGKKPQGPANKRAVAFQA